MNYISEKQNEKITQNYEKYNDYLKDIKDSLLEYIKKCNYEKIFIIVDELDRCRPDYAVDFLETINHIFNIKDLVFIFAIDREQLSSAMKVVYGKDLDFDAYFKKFVHYEFKLNDATSVNNETKDTAYIDKIIEKYSSNIKFTNKRKEYLSKLFKIFNLEPREINYSFAMINHFYSEKIHNSLNYLSENLFFLIVLKTKDYNLYYKLFSNSNFEYNIDVNLDVLKEIFKKYSLAEDITKEILINGLCFNNIINIEYNQTTRIKQQELMLIYLNTNFSDYLDEKFKKDIKNLDNNKINKYFMQDNSFKEPVLQYFFKLLESKKNKDELENNN